MDFSEQLLLKIVDSGIIGLVLLIIGYWLNKSLSRFKNDQAKLLELEKQNLTLKNSIVQDKRERLLENINNQLSKFYYPIYYRLQKDDALWRLSPILSSKEGALPLEVNDIIENEFILSNHLEIIDIIAANSHYIEDDPEFEEQIREYTKHVAIYSTIRRVESFKELRPEDFDSKYPKRFQRMVEEKIKELQTKHGKILDKMTID